MLAWENIWMLQGFAGGGGAGHLNLSDWRMASTLKPSPYRRGCKLPVAASFFFIPFSILGTTIPLLMGIRLQNLGPQQMPALYPTTDS